MKTHKIRDAISWHTTPSDMIVRIGDLMVHRVFQCVRSPIYGDEVFLECGARIPQAMALETTDPVDCMACMIRRTSMKIKAAWIGNGDTFSGELVVLS